MKPGESSYRCGGDCCRTFYIAEGEASRQNRAAWSHARIRAGEDSALDWENVFIDEMIIPIDSSGDPRGHQWFTCRHLDTASGLCTRYEERPWMCRGFPGYGRGGACHCGFTMPDPIGETVRVAGGAIAAELTQIARARRPAIVAG